MPQQFVGSAVAGVDNIPTGKIKGGANGKMHNQEGKRICSVKKAVPVGQGTAVSAQAAPNGKEQRFSGVAQI